MNLNRVIMEPRKPTRFNRAGDWLLTRFFRFMGFSGWLIVVLVILENRVAMPIAGGNTSLDVLMILTVVFWLITKYETRLVDWWQARNP